MACGGTQQRPGATGSRPPLSPHLLALTLVSALLALQVTQSRATPGEGERGESGPESETHALRPGTVLLPRGRGRGGDASVTSAWEGQGSSARAVGSRALQDRSYWGSGPHNFTRIAFYGDSLTQVGLVGPGWTLLLSDCTQRRQWTHALASLF